MGVYMLEHRWAKCASDRLTEDADFRWAHIDFGGYINKQNCRIWNTENPHAYIEKPTHPKLLLFGADFGPEA